MWLIREPEAVDELMYGCCTATADKQNSVFLSRIHSISDYQPGRGDKKSTTFGRGSIKNETTY